MRASAWTTIIVPIAAVVSFVIFRRVCAAPDAARETEPISEHERRVYRRWEIFAVVPVFLLVPLFTYLWYLGLTWAASLFDHHAPDTRFLVQPSGLSWIMPAFVLGILTVVIPLEGLYRGLLRERYARYQFHTEGRGGRVARKAFVCLASALSGGAAVWFLAGVTSFSRFTNVGVEIERPLSFRSQFHDYAGVELIEHRATFQHPSGTTEKRPHYVIHFDVGTSWSSREGLRDPVPEVDDQIAQLVSRQSGRPIVERP
jgi:hypothetical protein